MVLPAYAGMIPGTVALWLGRAGAPRVCGDDPSYLLTDPPAGACSPRMRG